MPDRDRYEDLLKYYEFIMGPLPGRDQLKRTLAETVTAEELEVFFLLPLIGHIPHSKLERKAKIGREAIVGMAVNKVLGPFRRSR